jgi:phospholipid-binding lipoprotein MlaA
MNALRCVALLLAMTVAAGCATAPATAPAPAQGAGATTAASSAVAGAAAGTAAAPARPRVANKSDPWEAFNRKVFAFNEVIDEAVLQPVAKAYRDVVPELVRAGIGNVIGNVGDVWSAANQFAQGKGQAGLEMSMRFLTNSFFGIAGVFDVASDLGIERQSEDFGQTLGRWGVGAGPYIVLPLLGPSALRETLALPIDRKASLSNLAFDGGTSYAATALEIVHTRAGLLAAGQLVNQIALDRYSFIRDAYLARRRNLVHDGNPPELPDDSSTDQPIQK